jgi:hypothetical protein
MSRTALLIAGVLFLVGAVFAGIETMWLLVFCALTLGLGCIAGAFLIQVDNPPDESATDAPVTTTRTADTPAS